MNTPQTLLTIENWSPMAGAPPRVTPGQYVGYLDTGDRQLVFVFSQAPRMAKIYISSVGWGKPITIFDGRFQNCGLTSDELNWAQSCWKAALRRFTRSALENWLEKNIWGTAYAPVTGEKS